MSTRIDAPKGLEILSDVEVESLPDPVWLIDGILTEQSLAALYGSSGDGKTFVGIHLGYCVATGQPFAGRAVQRGAVVYVYAEGGPSLKFRLRALKQERGISLSEECDVYFVREAVNLVDSSDGLNQIVAAIENKGIGAVSLVIIDTLAACFGTGDENSTQDMNIFTNICSQLRHQLGATVLVVHHTGWGEQKRERGSKSLRNNFDAMIRCVKTGEIISLISAKQRDGGLFDRIQFELIEVNLSADTSSCILRQSDAPQQVTNDADFALLCCLHRFGGLGATNGDWMNASKESSSNFYRRRKGLLKDGLVHGPNGGDSKGFRYTLTDLGRKQMGADQSQEKVELLPQLSSHDQRTVPQQFQADSAEVCTKHDGSKTVLNSPMAPSNGTGPHRGASRAPRGTDRDRTESVVGLQSTVCLDCLAPLLSGFPICFSCIAEVARV